MLRFAIKRHPKVRKKEYTFSPTFQPGKYSQASIHKVLCLLKGWIHQEGKQKSVLVNTATPHMGVHEDREDFEKELEQKFLQSKTGWCLSKKKN
jgi:hypothetical protein